MGLDDLIEIPVARTLDEEEEHAALPEEPPLRAEEQLEFAKAGRQAQGKVDDDEDGGEQSFQPMANVSPEKLSATGWGVVFAESVSAEVRKNLEPLLEWRKKQAGSRYRQFGYTQGTTKNMFLAVADGRGPVDPDKVPYYLLLVGSPTEIPFEFQYQLDVQYAVGRVYFENPADYRAYAQNVVDAEQQGLMRPKRAGFFAAATPGDKTTEGSIVHFIDPLTKITQSKKWEIDRRVREQATRAQLGQMLLNPPTVVATATHGALPGKGSSLEKTHTGALLCQDFQGQLNKSPAPTANCYFAGKDVPAEADLRGSIFLIFACFGAGIPQFEDFLSKSGRQQLADHAFLSALPMELLRRGALAVIGHVERAFYYSFEGLQGKEQMQTFLSVWDRLLNEAPVGFAMEFINGRYAELAAELTGRLLGAKDLTIQAADQSDLAKTWKLVNDARNYLIIGDPAVRICVTEKTRKLLMTSGTPSAAPLAAMARPMAGPDLEELAGRLAALLEKPVEVTTLAGEGGTVAARTRVGLDGKVVNEMATEDEGLRQMHAQAVERAMGERAELRRLVDEVLKRAQ